MTDDLAGNRTDGNRTYNAANQVVGYQYDAAGNLVNDGTRSYAYDAFSRLTQQGATAYQYNGDGTLVQAGTTRYTQDLAAPLTQVLNDGSADYLYGLSRLAAQTGVSRTWYSTDALGSVRQTLSDSGAVLTAAQYDPWGSLEAGSAAPFGFTGELSDGGLVNLRARWYNPSAGAFVSRDSFAGFAETPYSLAPYQYGYANPVLYGDPSGRCVGVLLGVDTAFCAAGAAATTAGCFATIVCGAAVVILAAGATAYLACQNGVLICQAQHFEQTGPLPSFRESFPSQGPPREPLPPLTPRPFDRSSTSSGGFSVGQACEAPGGFDWLDPTHRPAVATAPWGTGTTSGPVVLNATPINPATKFSATDADGLRRFGEEAEKLAGFNAMRMKSWGALWWSMITDKALTDPSYAENVLVYRDAGKIKGVLTVTEKSQYPDALYLSTLETLPGRAMAGLLKGAILESMRRGYEGRLVGGPAGQALENYISAGAVPYKGADYLLDAQKAQEFLQRFP